MVWSTALKVVSDVWNAPLIHQILPQYEDHINLLVPSALGMQDMRAWLPEKSGEYTTKSGYAISKLNITQTTPESFNWNQCIWNVKCPPKLRHFLWKVKHDALSVGDLLRRRGIETDGKCKRCSGDETVLHVFLTCPFAVKVWDLTPALFKPNPSVVASVIELFKQSQRMVNLPPSGISQPLFLWLLWTLWTSRNRMVFEEKIFNEREVILKAIKDGREWQVAQPLKPPTTSPKPPQNSSELSSNTQPNFNGTMFLWQRLG